MENKIQCLQTENSQVLLKQFLFISLMVMLFLAASESMAGTTGAEFKGAWDKVVGLVDGYGGKLIAGVALAIALIGSVLRFNPYVIFGALGVGIAASVGTTIIGSTVTAII